MALPRHWPRWPRWSRWQGAISLALLSLTGQACLGLSGLNDYRFGEPTTLFQRLDRTREGKLDLLLVIDNSRSMADKQELFATALPELVAGIVNPRCIDADGTPLPDEAQPGPLAECPAGSERLAAPLTDVHVGIISSSLGGHGADSCSEALPTYHPSLNDMAHLLNRVDPDGNQTVPTWNDLGFLVWDPTQTTHTPPGSGEPTAFSAALADIVLGAGELGCGFEAVHEAWYRFLVEPAPYASVVVGADGLAYPEGVDQVVLDQRAAFLRDDSLLAIIMLSDEDDCSIKDGGIHYIVGQLEAGGMPYRMPRPRAACATDPNDPCCKSCGESPGPGCDTSNDDCSSRLSIDEDAINLRCFDQKRRFGIDFLQPTERYVAALSQPSVPDRDGIVTPNPIFTGERQIADVSLTGIVGVPWQDIMRRDESGTPDPALGFQSAEELAALGTWDVVVGDPSCYHTDASCLPTDPLMIQSVDPRAGDHPIVDAPVAPPGSAQDTNPINGHEYSIPMRDDLQYACAFALETPVPCTIEEICDCKTADNDNPLCSDRDKTLQTHAKAYPATRTLALLRALGEQAVVGSICPPSNTLGYRPATQALLERLPLAPRFCLEAPPSIADDGSLDCTVVEARNLAAEGEGELCTCAGTARAQLTDAALPTLASIQAHPSFAAGNWDCYCEVTQVVDAADRAACQSDVEEPVLDAFGNRVDGWCYVDASANPILTAACSDSGSRALRFAGDGRPDGDAALFIDCR